MSDYKSILVKNSHSRYKVTLFLYHNKDPVCLFSYKSVIIRPGQNHLYRTVNKFQYKLEAHGTDGKIEVSEDFETLRIWTSDKHIEIPETTPLKALIKDLEDFPQETRLCLRKRNRDEEIATRGLHDLYKVLELEADKTRKLKSDEQDEVIRKAFRKQILYWHPDRSHGDKHHCEEILFAYSILKDPDKRYEYNRQMDYNKGWLSLSRWKSIFWPECRTEEEKSSYRKRMFMMALSAGVLIGGVVLSAVTAGMALPISISMGSLGGGLFGAGVTTEARLFKKESILNGCEWKDYFKTAAFGFGAGALTGGATMAASAGILGSAATATVGQYIGAGAASAAVGGGAFSLASDCERKFVDNEEVTWKQMAGHAIAGAVIGGGTGAAVGGVFGAVVNGLSSEITAANIEGKVARIAGGRKLGNYLARNISRAVTESTAENVLGSGVKFLEERLDKDMENRPITEHAKDAAKNLAQGIAAQGVVASVQTVAAFVQDEYISKKNNSVTPNIDTSEGDDDGLTNTRKVKTDVADDFDENFGKMKAVTGKAYENTVNVVQDSNINSIIDQELTELQNGTNIDQDSDQEQDTGCISYQSTGSWRSRMKVEYKINGQRVTEFSNKEHLVIIPSQATDIEVSFQVLRFINVWCDLKKWNRFENRWEEGVHKLFYQRPMKREVLISGPLYYEAIIKVKNAAGDDVDN